MDEERRPPKLHATRERTTVACMQRLRPVTSWIRAFWLGLALLLPLHAMATGLGWCPMARAALEAAVVAEPEALPAHCAEHGTPAAAAAGPSGVDTSASSAVMSHDAAGGDTACVLCAAHASTAAWVPHPPDWAADPSTQDLPRLAVAAPGDAFVPGLERPPRA